MTTCHHGHLGKCLLLHFPARIPVLLPFMAQLCCICDFVSPALVVSLKCNKVSSGATKHQRPPQTNRNSGSGVHSPTRLTAATPATSRVWWCFSVPFRPACLWRTLCVYVGLLCPQKKLTLGLSINPDTCLATFYYVWCITLIFILFNQFSSIKTVMVTMETIASASPRHRNLP